MAAERAWTLPEVALVAAGLLLLLWQPAFFLNDELAQALGHRALAEGRLETRELTPGYDEVVQGVYTHHNLRALEQGPVQMSGSALENVLALPVRGILLVLAAPFGLGAALGLVTGAGAGGAAWAVMRRRAGDRSALWLGAGVASVLLLGAAARTSAFPADPWLDVASLQLVTIAWTAVAAALWFDLVRRGWGTGPAWFAAALWLLGTPTLFWALNIKYHGLAIALESAAVWAYRDGHRTPPLRTFLAAALVGLAVWNHAPSGGLLGAALALAALPGLRRGLPFLRTAGAGVAGLAVGLLPFSLWQLLAARASAPSGVAGDGSAGGVGDGGGAGGDIDPLPVGAAAREAGAADGALFSGSVWNDPAGALGALGQTFVWADWWDVGAALSVLAWAPWVLLGLVTVARRDLRARVPLWPVAVLYAVVPVLLVGDRMLDVGAGYDLRHHATAWPWLVLLAWPAVAERLRDRPASWWTGQVAAAAAVGMTVLLVVNLLWHKATGVDVIQMGYAFEGTWAHRYGGTALAAALAAWLALGRWVRRRWPAVTDRRVLDPLLAWSVAASLTLGVWLRLTVALPQSVNTAPFVAWPVGLLSEALRWVAYSY